MLERAAELGLSALALTDVDTLAGTVDFLKAAEGLGGPRPILGAEVSDPSGRPGCVIALAEDERGYRNLCKVVSARQLGADPGEREARERIPRQPRASRMRRGKARRRRVLAEEYSEELQRCHGASG